MAQVIKKRRIVLASVLKPVDEPRMYAKFARSLADSQLAEVHVFGFPATITWQPDQEVFFHPVAPRPFSRFSRMRFVAPLKIFREVLRLKPDCLIITTHELLLVAMLCKAILQCRVLYDIQENYFLNILYTNSFPRIVRPFIAGWVRFKEVVTSPLIDHFILAEAGYIDELRFAKPYSVLQNKLPGHLALQFKINELRGYNRFLFTGTLAETTGVFETIGLIKRLRQTEPASTLTIIGSCHSPELLSKLNNEVKENAFISLLAAPYPIPHHAILREIQQSDVGIIIYPPNPSTRCSIPSKVYEYIALQLPILIRHTEESHKLVIEYHAGVILPENPNPADLFNQLKALDRIPPDAQLFWESEFQSVKNIVLG